MAKVKYILLIPLNYNDGRKVPRSVIDAIKEQLFTLAGGYTYRKSVQGAYRMKSGDRQLDQCAEFWVVIDEKKERVLRKLAEQFAELLDQESIYFERALSIVEFIERPSRKKRSS